MTTIGSFCFPLPPLIEQHKIVAILNTWREAIEKLERLIALKRERKRALMEGLLTGRVRFKEFEGQSEFQQRCLGEIAYIDQRSLGNHTDPEFAFKYISLSDIETGRILDSIRTLQFKEAPSRARKLVQDNDILMATVRPNLKGFAMLRKDARQYVVSTGFAVITAKPGYSPDYIYHYIFSSHIEQQINALVTGSNYPAISSSEIRNLQISCPTLPEQQKIASTLSAADAEIEKLHKQLQAYKLQKRGLMQQLLTGKKRVRVEEQVPA